MKTLALKLLLGILVLLANPAWGQQGESVPMSHYLIDSSGSLSISEAMAMPDYGWEPLREAASFGYDTRTYWFKQTLPVSTEARLLHVEYPLLDHLDIYFIDASRPIAHFALGDQRPFAARPIPHEDFVVPIPRTQAPVQVLIRVQTESSVSLPTRIWPTDQFHSAQGPRQLAFGIYFGVLLCMVVYNLFGYGMTREPSFFSYSIYVVFIGLMMAALSGAGFRYFWPENLWIQDRAIVLFGSLSFAFACVFISQLLNIKQHSEFLHRGLWIAGSAAMLIAVGSTILPYATSIKFLLAFAIVACIFILSLAFAMWKKGLVYARVFTLAWFAFLSAVVLNSLAYLGVIDGQFIQRYAIMAGSGLEVLLLSWVLTLRYSEERSQKLAAQDEALRQAKEAQDAQRQLNEQLEERVEERTFELEVALRELQEVNNALERKNSEDGLTGLFNRRHFDRQLTLEFRRAWRNQEPLSLIMLDIDYFKPVNDQYGHMIGDQILVALAKRLKDTARRPGDTLCRYGGEEFALILAGSDEQDAFQLAQRIGAAVRDTAFHTDAGELTITVSMGVCTANVGMFEVPEQLLKAADDALYAAKERGRDQTVIARNQVLASELSISSTGEDPIS
ncbi:sensor domain-containing diguanylate cyclase [Aliidiomarina celeris]|uniref:sensor domain-containing diguanylate cyclase n=1 Tax=Aliidiomarina celeris TaxID=2249428 RepID=UPI000DEBF376|nr:diguanylate cyclase [Aliidiomarina celeris]